MSVLHNSSDSHQGHDDPRSGPQKERPILQPLAHEVGQQREIRRGGGHVPAGEPKGMSDRSRPSDDLLSCSLQERGQDHHSRPEPPPSARFGRGKPDEKKGPGEQKLPRAEVPDHLEDRDPCWRDPAADSLIDQPFPWKQTPRADEKCQGKEDPGVSQKGDSPAESRRDQLLQHQELIGKKTFRRLDAPQLLADVASGVVYVNGVRAPARRQGRCLTRPPRRR